MSTCKWCGSERVTWRQVDGRWKLFDGETPHHCVKPPEVPSPKKTILCGYALEKKMMEANGGLLWTPEETFSKAWNKQVLKCSLRQEDPFPSEAEDNLNHPWWNFLDTVPMMSRIRPKDPNQIMLFNEIIP
jgi:hypothetical protein